MKMLKYNNVKEKKIKITYTYNNLRYSILNITQCISKAYYAFFFAQFSHHLHV